MAKIPDSISLLHDRDIGIILKALATGVSELLEQRGPPGIDVKPEIVATGEGRSATVRLKLPDNLTPTQEQKFQNALESIKDDLSNKHGILGILTSQGVT